MNDIKVKPPFTNLAVFNVNATILSYIGFKHEVLYILKQLAVNSKRYCSHHKDILDNYLVA